ncbi:MAG: phosphopantetheine-binding protein, partial [Myxococcota bacterium]
VQRAFVEVVAERRASAGLACKRCGVTSDVPGVTIREDGICDVCAAYAQYRERVLDYFRTMDDLQVILDEARERSAGTHDVLLLLSGGKDSSYALVRLVQAGARVLTATLDNGYISQSAIANIERVTGELGVEHVFLSTPHMNAIFRDSLERHANVCQGCFKTIYTLGTELAQERGISVIVTGLSRGQMFETRLSPALFEGRSVEPAAIDKMVLDARKAYHRADDGTNRILKPRIFEDEKVFEEIRYVDFYRYCDVSLEEMMATLDAAVPWVRPADTGRSTNCLINDVGIWVHRRKAGFHNYALPYSWDVRLGHKTRAEAVDELNDEIDPQKVRDIVAEIGYEDPELELEPGAPRLVGYVVGDVEVREIRPWLEERVPPAAIPTYFERLEELPLTANGKLDRAALPQPSTSRRSKESTYSAPTGPREETLARLWALALRLPRVGRDDNYFDLGGESMAALQIVAKAADEGLAFTAAELFETQTVATLARVVREVETAKPAPKEGPGVGLARLAPVARQQLASALAKRKRPT